MTSVWGIGLVYETVVNEHGASARGHRTLCQIRDFGCVAELDERPVQYRTFIRNRFGLREVIVSSIPLMADHVAGGTLEAKVRDIT